jgi:hypothetical protein
LQVDSRLGQPAPNGCLPFTDRMGREKANCRGLVDPSHFLTLLIHLPTRPHTF